MATQNSANGGPAHVPVQQLLVLVLFYCLIVHSTGLHSATTYTVSAIANEPAPKEVHKL